MTAHLPGIAGDGCERCRCVWEAALAVAGMHPELFDPTGAKNQCQIAANNVRQVLTDRGSTDDPQQPLPKNVWLRGHRRPELPHHGHPRGIAEHVVLQTAGGCLIDLTRRQFDPAAPVPLHYPSLAAAGSDWCWVNEDGVPDIDEGWRALP